MKIRNSVVSDGSAANAGNSVFAHVNSRCRLLLACRPAAATADQGVVRTLVVRFLSDDKPCSLHALRHVLFASAVRCTMRVWGFRCVARAMEDDPVVPSAAVLCGNLPRALLAITGGKLGTGPFFSASRARSRSGRDVVQVPAYLHIVEKGYAQQQRRVSVLGS